MLIVTLEAAENVRNQAEALAMGVEAEVLSPSVALEWARRSAPRTDAQVIGHLSALTKMAGQDGQAVARALRQIPGVWARDVAEVLLVRLLLEMRRDDAAAADAMLGKLVVSFLIQDDELRRAANDHHQRRAELQHRDVDPGLLGSDPALVAACERFVQRTARPLDAEWGWDLPPWATPPSTAT